MAPKKVVEVKLTHSKSTKWQEVYATDVVGALVTNVYVNRKAFGDDQHPAEITVTITA